MIVVCIWNAALNKYEVVKSFNIWTDAENYARKKYNYPDSNCIITII